MDFLVVVAPALNAALALDKVAGPPRAVQIVHGDELFLDVRPGSHLGCTANEDTHLTSVDLRKQVFFLFVGFGVMDKGDFL